MKLGKQSTAAELRFTSQGMNLYGTVIQMNTEEISIRLYTVPVSHDLFAADNAVELVVIARNRVFMAATKVRSEHRGTLTLAFSAPVRTIQRRKEQRIPCELDVNFRAVQGHGCFGLWKHAETINLSSIGMCLLAAPPLARVRMVEILFVLPDVLVGEDESTLLCSDDGIEILKMYTENRLELPRTLNRDRPVKVTARVTNQRQRGDGNYLLGLCFTMLSTADHVRFARFLNPRTNPSS